MSPSYHHPGLFSLPLGLCFFSFCLAFPVLFLGKAWSCWCQVVTESRVQSTAEPCLRRGNLLASGSYCQTDPPLAPLPSLWASYPSCCFLTYRGPPGVWARLGKESLPETAPGSGNPCPPFTTSLPSTVSSPPRQRSRAPPTPKYLISPTLEPAAVGKAASGVRMPSKRKKMGFSDPRGRGQQGIAGTEGLTRLGQVCGPPGTHSANPSRQPGSPELGWQTCFSTYPVVTGPAGGGSLWTGRNRGTPLSVFSSPGPSRQTTGKVLSVLPLGQAPSNSSGVDSVHTPGETRHKLWLLLSTELS